MITNRFCRFFPSLFLRSLRPSTSILVENDFPSTRLVSSSQAASHFPLKNRWTYEEERRDFFLPRPTHYNFTHDQIEARAADNDDRHRLAFWWADDRGNEIRWSFDDLARLTRKTAAVLEQDLNLQRGDRLLVVLPKLPGWWLLCLASIRCGIIVIPGTPQMTANDLQYRMERSKAAGIVVAAPLMAAVDEVVSKCPSVRIKALVREEGEDKLETTTSWFHLNEAIDAADDDYPFLPTLADDHMMIFFTSGTTGFPKMAVHTHASFGLANLITGKYWMDLDPTDVHFNFSDLGWAKAAWSNLFAPWILGSCVFVYHPNEVGKPHFHPPSVLRALKDFPITTFCIAPSAFSLLVQEDLSQFLPFSALRHCITAGEALRPEVARSWMDATGVTIREGYGQSELVLLLANFPVIQNKVGSMGKPAPGMDVRVIDDFGRDCPPGVEGVIALKVSPHPPMGIFAGYLDDPERTAASLRGDFYLTGDRARTDDDGYFWFVGRDDDVINTSGYRVGPVEVESVLVDHPDVVDAAVIGVADERRGQAIKAFVVPTEKRRRSMRDDSSEEALFAVELQDHVKKLTAPYKYPRDLEFVEELPKTTSGKIKRTTLREMEREKAKAGSNMLGANFR